MLNSIKKYLKKAKEEVTKEYSIHSSDQTLDDSNKELPKMWTGVDLDGTLAYYNRMSSYDEVGEPVPAMLALVKKMINNGIRVKIFTARVQDPEQLPLIRKWFKENGLPELEITNIKDYNMQRLYDDRCIQVERNTGRLIVDN
ncbi:MAG: hypothetical protein K8S13_03285 [Desulfobacula sp.]|uniref:hypothetical protein n=1 Tax=Desulfobacula sp. TaxID=2593537 RepID=UPI0025BD3331|nr:hypothetical protein [Desulfobacula sp.]MCD4718868.1 hypothetical protein [Desulfobacula sp.]